ncbi:MAG: type I methionyl aminopeptidase [Planctomycetota bacterium]
MSEHRNRTPEDLAGAAAAADCVVQTHQRLADYLRPGLTLAEIDRFVAETLDRLHCKSCFLGYRVPRSPAFPSHACLSVNDCVVHGTAGYRAEPIVEGDVVKIDIGVLHEGWIGDAAWTYFMGEPDDERSRLRAAGRAGIRAGVEALQPGAPLLDWARAVQGCVEDEHGLHLVRGLGGHGYGRRMHEPPWISNVVPAQFGEWTEAQTKLEPGMLLAVEPMLAIGTGQTKPSRGQWPIFMADGSLSAHYEHDVLITEDGPKVLTAGLEEIGDIIR